MKSLIVDKLDRPCLPKDLVIDDKDNDFSKSILRNSDANHKIWVKCNGNSVAFWTLKFAFIHAIHIVCQNAIISLDERLPILLGKLLVILILIINLDIGLVSDSIQVFM